MTLETSKALANKYHAEFLSLIDKKFPGLTKWHWYRAVAAMKGDDVRRNDDQSQDVALAADAEIRIAHDAYITNLHRFYRARDGEHGFLGGR